MAALRASSDRGSVATLASAARSAESQPGDRWLLMRLLAAGQSLPRLADRLIDEQGSLGSVLATSDERLRQLGADSNGIAILRLVRETIGAVLRRDATERPLVADGAALADAMHAEMAWLPVEQMRVAFLDVGRRLMRIEILSTGSIHQTHVFPREIARRALELSAAAVVLVHNHPSGDPMPSALDIDLTGRIERALSALDVELLDHLVIARRGCVSFSLEGLLDARRAA